MADSRLSTGLLILAGIFISLGIYAQGNSDSTRFVHYGTSFDTVINEVLDAYPMIRKDQVQFKEKDIKTTMATRPKLDFIFRKRKNRVYQIFIDTLVEDSNGLLLRYLPKDALIGILAHEFAHIIDYEACSNRGIIRLGYNYSSTRGRVEVENRVDSITMEYGFVEESIAFAEFLAKTGLVSKEYKDYKARFYNSVDDLKEMGKRIAARKTKEERKEKRLEKKEKRQEKKEKKAEEKEEKKEIKEAEKEERKEVKETEKEERKEAKEAGKEERLSQRK